MLLHDVNIGCSLYTDLIGQVIADLSFLQKGCGLQELPLVPQKLVFIDFFRDLGTGYNYIRPWSLGLMTPLVMPQKHSLP